jgi:HEAT repeat protein
MPSFRSLLLIPVALLLVAGLGRPSLVVGADREPTALEVYRKFRKHHDPSKRRRAVQALAPERGAPTTEALLEALSDEDGRVRSAARSGLLIKRDRAEELEILVRRGLRKGSVERQVVVIEALAAAGKSARQALVDALSHKRVEVRRAVARALGACEDASIARHLSACLLDADARVRAIAVAGLGSLQGSAAAGSAAAVLRADRSPEPRVAATGVLALAPSVDTAVHLGYGVTDSNWSVRVGSARACEELAVDVEAARSIVPKLIAALGREERLRVRAAFGDALRKLTGLDFGPDHPVHRERDELRTPDTDRRHPTCSTCRSTRITWCSWWMPATPWATRCGSAGSGASATRSTSRSPA